MADLKTCETCLYYNPEDEGICNACIKKDLWVSLVTNEDYPDTKGYCAIERAEAREW